MRTKLGTLSYTHSLPQLVTRFACARESELRKVRMKSDKFCDKRLRTVTSGLYTSTLIFPSLFSLFLLLSKVSRLLCYFRSPVYASNWSLVVPRYSTRSSLCCSRSRLPVIEYLTIILRVRIGCEMIDAFRRVGYSRSISYLATASGIIVPLKTLPKYRILR